MTNPLQILRTSTALSRPAGRQAGELYWNDADDRFGIIKVNGTTEDIGWPDVPDDSASYARRRVIGTQLGTWEEIAPLKTYTVLTLNVATTGVADPLDPPGGDPFDTLSSLILWVDSNIGSCDTLTINVGGGTFVEPLTVQRLPASCMHIRLIGAGVGLSDLSMADTLYTQAAALLFISNITLTSSDSKLLEFECPVQFGGSVTLNNTNATQGQAIIAKTHSLTLINNAILTITGTSVRDLGVVECRDLVLFGKSVTCTITNNVLVGTNNGYAMQIANGGLILGNNSTLNLQGGAANDILNILGSFVDGVSETDILGTIDIADAAVSGVAPFASVLTQAIKTPVLDRPALLVERTGGNGQSGNTFEVLNISGLVAVDFNSNLRVTTSIPYLFLEHDGGALDRRVWGLNSTGIDATFRPMNDLGTVPRVGGADFVFNEDGSAPNNDAVLRKGAADILYAPISSRRYKSGIFVPQANTVDPGNMVDDLVAKAWTWGGELPTSDARHKATGYGLIAEEVDEILPEAVRRRWTVKPGDQKASLEVDGLDPLALVALALTEIKALRKRVAQLESNQ